MDVIALSLAHSELVSSANSSSSSSNITIPAAETAEKEKRKMESLPSVRLGEEWFKERYYAESLVLELKRTLKEFRNKQFRSTLKVYVGSCIITTMECVLGNENR